MRVLFWTLNFQPPQGGIPVLACRMLPDLMRRGFEFRVIAVSRKEEAAFHFEGIPVHVLPLWDPCYCGTRTTAPRSYTRALSHAAGKVSCWWDPSG